MITLQEHDFITILRQKMYLPSAVSETAMLSQIQTKLEMAYPGEQKYPRRMDVQFALPRRNNSAFFLNVEINRGAAYNELKLSRMLDPRLVERCDRVLGRENYLNILICGTNARRGQAYGELTRYVKPCPETNLMVIICSLDLTDDDARKVGIKLRKLSRQLMGL
jgi:hypothetical protein